MRADASRGDNKWGRDIVLLLIGAVLYFVIRWLLDV
jgi:hypothetical protein